MSLNRTNPETEMKGEVGRNVEMDAKMEIEGEAKTEIKETASTPAWKAPRGEFSAKNKSTILFDAVSSSQNIISIALTNYGRFDDYADRTDVRLYFTIFNPQAALPFILEDDIEHQNEEGSPEREGYCFCERFYSTSGLINILQALEKDEPSVAQIKGKIIDAYAPGYLKARQENDMQLNGGELSQTRIVNALLNAEEKKEIKIEDRTDLSMKKDGQDDIVNYGNKAISLLVERNLMVFPFLEKVENIDCNIFNSVLIYIVCHFINSDEKNILNVLDIVAHTHPPYFYSVLNGAIKNLVRARATKGVGVLLKVVKSQYPHRFTPWLTDVVSSLIIDKSEQEVCLLGKTAEKKFNFDFVLRSAVVKSIEKDKKIDNHALVRIVESYCDHYSLQTFSILSFVVSKLIQNETEVDIEAFLQIVMNNYPADFFWFLGEVISDLVKSKAWEKTSTFLKMIKSIDSNELNEAINYAINKLIKDKCNSGIEALSKALKSALKFAYPDEYMAALFYVIGNTIGGELYRKPNPLLLKMVKDLYPDEFAIELRRRINLLIKTEGEKKAYKLLEKMSVTYTKDIVDALGDKIVNFIKVTDEGLYPLRGEGFNNFPVYSYRISDLAINGDDTKLNAFLKDAHKVAPQGYFPALGYAISHLIKVKANTNVDRLLGMVKALPPFPDSNLSESFSCALADLIRSKCSKEVCLFLEMVRKESTPDLGRMIYPLLKGRLLKEAETLLRWAKKNCPNSFIFIVESALTWGIKEGQEIDLVLKIVREKYSSDLSIALAHAISALVSLPELKGLTSVLGEVISRLLQAGGELEVRALLLTNFEMVKERLRLQDNIHPLLIETALSNALTKLVGRKCDKEVYTLLDIARDTRPLPYFIDLLNLAAAFLKYRAEKLNEEGCIAEAFVLKSLASIDDVGVRYQLANDLKEHLDEEDYDPLTLISRAQAYNVFMRARNINYNQLLGWIHPMTPRILLQGLALKEKDTELPLPLPLDAVQHVVSFLSPMSLPDMVGLAKTFDKKHCNEKFFKENKGSIVEVLLSASQIETFEKKIQGSKKIADIPLAVNKQKGKTRDSRLFAGSRSKQMLDESKENIVNILLNADPINTSKSKRKEHDSMPSDDFNKRQKR